MKLERLGKNIHKLYLDKDNNKVALLSDLHWDNPKCDRELLKKNLAAVLREHGRRACRGIGQRTARTRRGADLQLPVGPAGRTGSRLSR